MSWHTCIAYTFLHIKNKDLSVCSLLMCNITQKIKRSKDVAMLYEKNVSFASILLYTCCNLTLSCCLHKWLLKGSHLFYFTELSKATDDNTAYLKFLSC